VTVASVRVQQIDGIPVATVTGEIDIVNAGEIGGQLFAASPNTAAGLIVDLSGVSYLDSRGVHLLFELANRLRMRHQGLHLAVPPRALIRRVLLLTHVDSVIPLHPEVAEAVGALKAQE
jgi:stage II sporulation protein AA (anti-sigma F factor antagonist)